MLIANTEEKPLPTCTNCLTPTDPTEYMYLDHTCQRCWDDWMRHVIENGSYLPEDL